MTAREMIAKVGSRVSWPVQDGVEVEAEVLDLKNAYGNRRLLIRPVAGTGETWVNASSVRPCATHSRECPSIAQEVR